jgi:peptidoglycan-associated lipoprotein
MALKLKLPAIAAILSLSWMLASCTDDEAKPDEAVQPTSDQAPEILTEEPPPVAFSAETIYFDFDDYTIKPEAQEKLGALAAHMKANAGVVVQVEGHCDERGSNEYNLALGERRAQSVKTYLSDMGIDAARVQTISYGEEKPTAEGHDEQAWGQNRRGEFVMTVR